MDVLLQDLRYATRSLAKMPGFTAIAVLCLAAGIGVTTAAFSVMNSLAFRDLPGIHRQKDLVEIHTGYTEEDGVRRPAMSSLPDYEEFRGALRTLEGVAASGREQAAVQIPGSSRTTTTFAVAVTSTNFFTLLGARPAQGRFYTDADEAMMTSRPMVVVSDAFWRTQLDSASDVAGRTLFINGSAFTIAGVAEPSFVGVDQADVMDDERGAPQLWIPLAMAGVIRPSAVDPRWQWDGPWLRFFGRLREGFSMQDAQLEAAAVVARTERREPVIRREARAVVAKLGTPPGGFGEVLAAALLLLSVPVMVLVVACANVANMLLARGTAREKEIAVRVSLGAPRRRIIRQLLTESVLLASTAAFIGTLIALASGKVVLVMLGVPGEAPVDLRVLAFTVTLVVATALLFGLVPALRSARTDVNEVLKDGSGGAGYRRSFMRSALVVAQIGVSVLLIATAGIFIRTIGIMRGSETGMDHDQLLLAAVDPGLIRYSAEKGAALREDAIARARALPGVAAVGTANWLAPDSPPKEERVSRINQDPKKGYWVRSGVVGGEYFKATGIPIRHGRMFTESDRAGAAKVAIINELLARRLAPDADYRSLVGTQLRFGVDTTAVIAEVVGIAGNTMNPIRNDRHAMAFFPVAQQYKPMAALHIRTFGDPGSLLPAMRRELQALDPSVPILQVTAMPSLMERQLSGLVLTGNAMLGLGTLALLLAASGVYAVMSYIISQRTKEIGVRVALGAQRRAVVVLVLRQVIVLAITGIVVGLAASTGAGVMIAHELNGARAVDPIMFVVVSSVLVAVALAAASAPAARAARVDPMVALRHD